MKKENKSEMATPRKPSDLIRVSFASRHSYDVLQEMYLLGVIGFIFFGVLALSVAVWHEFSWWKRRGWTHEQGTIVGISESKDSDGVSYCPEIQYQGAEGATCFISNYGSSKKPHIGSSVDLMISESRHSAEVASASNRLLLTIIPAILGMIFIVVGANIKPVEEAEQGGDGDAEEAV